MNKEFKRRYNDMTDPVWGTNGWADVIGIFFFGGIIVLAFIFLQYTLTIIAFIAVCFFSYAVYRVLKDLITLRK